MKNTAYLLTAIAALSILKSHGMENPLVTSLQKGKNKATAQSIVCQRKQQEVATLQTMVNGGNSAWKLWLGTSALTLANLGNCMLLSDTIVSPYALAGGLLNLVAFRASLGLAVQAHKQKTDCNKKLDVLKKELEQLVQNKTPVQDEPNQISEPELSEDTTFINVNNCLKGIAMLELLNSIKDIAITCSAHDPSTALSAGVTGLANFSVCSYALACLEHEYE